MRAANDDDTSHWWLVGPKGVIDLMYGPSDHREIRPRSKPGYPYHRGKGAMFQGGYNRPSKRAAAIIELVTSRRRAGQ